MASECTRGDPSRIRFDHMSEAQVVSGNGSGLATLDDLGEGPGFRKIRKELELPAFGANALVIPNGYGGNDHYHDQQEELYFVHKGRAEFTFGDGTTHVVGPGSVVRRGAATRRRYMSVGGRGSGDDRHRRQGRLRGTR